MRQLKILLSFDHELSLGGARSYEQNLFDPTDRLLELAGELEVPITLFTDVCCAIRFREWEEDGFYRVYCRQIGRAIRHGHDVQLHVHPHWMDSEYSNGTFVPSPHFALGEFRDRAPPLDIAGIIKQGVEFLAELCRKEAADYKCIAFRAGGFNLAPETAAVLCALHDNGIRIDSSIPKGFYFKSGISEVDHRAMPKKANWYVAPQGPLNREAAEGLFEVPIVAKPANPLGNLVFLGKWLRHRRRSYRSGGWPIHRGNYSVMQRIRGVLFRSASLLGFDSCATSLTDLMRILRHYVNRHAADDTIVCSAVSHPKAMGEYARSLMSGFVERTRRDFGHAVEFSTYRRVYDELFLGGYRRGEVHREVLAPSTGLHASTGTPCHRSSRSKAAQEAAS